MGGREQHPDAAIITGSLYQVDVPKEDAMALRDHFFTRSGFTVKPTSGGGGTFHARSIKDLKTTWNTDKATEITAPLLAEAVSAQMEAPVLHQQHGAGRTLHGAAGHRTEDLRRRPAPEGEAQAPSASTLHGASGRAGDHFELTLDKDAIFAVSSITFGIQLGKG